MRAVTLLYCCVLLLTCNALSLENPQLRGRPSETVGQRVAKWLPESGVNPEELGEYFEGDIMSSPTRNGMLDETYRWKNGVVPYEIGGSFGKDLEIIEWAMNEYHKRTCIR